MKMFTGLIETTGTIAEVESGQGSTRIAVVHDLPGEEISDGESIAVDGVCLTVTSHDRERFRMDVVQETLSRTTLGGLAVGSRVNLERSLRVGDRLGGHLVQGHVDGAAEVLEARRQGDDYRLRLSIDPSLRRYVALRGSIALHGVSLTVAAVSDDAFEVALIPETLSRTTLAEIGPGDRVNVEVDLVARYLEALQEDP